MNKDGFSVVIPSYTGSDQIKDCLKSMLDQNKMPNNFEVVVIADGSKEVYDRAQSMTKMFDAKKVKFRPIQLKKNVGRFEARIAGAEAAKYEQILFVDDRVRLGPSFFKYLEKTNEQAIMPNVIELESSNLIAVTINSLRKLIYGEKWGVEYEDYYLGKDNFESSPKGTTSLFIPKKVFLSACQEVRNDLRLTASNRISDDTKVLYHVVNSGNRIFRPGKLVINYLPRSGFREACQHLFKRGPLFVDYYHSPRTRFFPILAGVYLAALAMLATAVFQPIWLFYYLICFIAAMVLAAAIIAKRRQDYFAVLVGLPLVLLIFSAGILAGGFLKLVNK